MRWKGNLSVEPSWVSPTAQVMSHHYLHISGDSSAIVWHLYSSTTQNQFVRRADSAYRLFSLLPYMTDVLPPALCAAERNPDSSVSGQASEDCLDLDWSFRPAWQFLLPFKLYLRSARAQRSRGALLFKSFWNWKRSLSLRRKLTRALTGHQSEYCVQQSMHLKHKLGSIRQMNMTFEGSKLIYSRQITMSHANHPVCEIWSIHILKQIL